MEFDIFIQKSQEYGLENHNLFIGSRSTTSAEYSTKQDVSFNLSERKNHQSYEYAVNGSQVIYLPRLEQMIYL